MTVGYILGLLAIGLAAGFMSSLVGIGGGIIIVPALVFFYGMTQKTAQGTSLFLLSLPVAAFAAYNYYKGGYSDVKVGAIIAVAFIVGGFLGSRLVVEMDMSIVKKIFAIFMIIVAIKYLFFDK